MNEERDIFEVMYTNRAVRQFLPDPVPDEQIQRVLEAATRAPNGSNAQRWRFLVLRDPGVRARIGAYYSDAYYKAYRPSHLGQVAAPNVARPSSHLADHMGDEPPVLILVCMERSAGGSSGRTSGSSIYPAVQNLMLAARALGLGTCLTTIHQHREAEIKKYLGIPEEVDTYALIPIGLSGHKVRAAHSEPGVRGDALRPMGRRSIVRARPEGQWLDIEDTTSLPPPDRSQARSTLRSRRR